MDLPTDPDLELDRPDAARLLTAGGYKLTAGTLGNLTAHRLIQCRRIKSHAPGGTRTLYRWRDLVQLAHSRMRALAWERSALSTLPFVQPPPRADAALESVMGETAPRLEHDQQPEQHETDTTGGSSC
jgi:hypothetical protein